MLMLVAVAAFMTWTATAQAQSASFEPSESDSGGSYWSLALQGGLLVPLDTMEDSHQRSLAAGGRLGWTSSHGLGVDLAVEYTPLSRAPSPAGDTYETHFMTSRLMPRFTLGKKYVRLWVAAGGGLAYERSTQIEAGGTAALGTSNEYAMAGTGAAGLEFHPFSGVGLAAMGSYTRTYGGLEYQFLNLTGGLVLTFD